MLTRLGLGIGDDVTSGSIFPLGRLADVITVYLFVKDLVGTLIAEHRKWTEEGGPMPQRLQTAMKVAIAALAAIILTLLVWSVVKDDGPDGPDGTPTPGMTVTVPPDQGTAEPGGSGDDGSPGENGGSSDETGDGDDDDSSGSGDDGSGSDSGDGSDDGSGGKGDGGDESGPDEPANAGPDEPGTGTPTSALTTSPPTGTPSTATPADTVTATVTPLPTAIDDPTQPWTKVPPTEDPTSTPPPNETTSTPPTAPTFVLTIVAPTVEPTSVHPTATPIVIVEPTRSPTETPVNPTSVPETPSPTDPPVTPGPTSTTPPFTCEPVGPRTRCDQPDLRRSDLRVTGTACASLDGSSVTLRLQVENRSGAAMRLKGTATIDSEWNQSSRLGTFDLEPCPLGRELAADGTPTIIVATVPLETHAPSADNMVATYSVRFWTCDPFTAPRASWTFPIATCSQIGP